MEDEIGKVTHIFSKISVGVIEVTQGELRVGDRIHIKGRISDFYQVVESMQKEHSSVAIAKAGESIGLKVQSPVHEHDLVFKVQAEP